LRTAPRMAAMARWFQWAWLSKMRFWSLPRSMAMSTVRWAVVTGVITRFARELERQAVPGTDADAHAAAQAEVLLELRLLALRLAGISG